jgi:hypothetical protein
VGREKSDDDDEERPAVSRPTVRPDFDPRVLAEQSEIRERATTITDEVALEAARVQSMPTKPPGPRASVSDAEVSATAEDDLSALSPEEQIAVLRDRLAPLGRVPSLATKLDELGEDLQDPKAAFIVGFVDGLLPLETIIEVTGLPERDTLEVLDRLIEQGHVVFKKR